MRGCGVAEQEESGKSGRSSKAPSLPVENHTIKLLEDTFNGPGAATAGHGNIELVLVLRHFKLCSVVEEARMRTTCTL